MMAGRLDRRIRIEQRTVTRAEDGSEVSTWTLFAVVWAQALPSRGNERHAAGAEQADRDMRFRIRWRPGVSAAMRVVHEGTEWDIVAVAELGRRVGMELSCVGTQP